MQIAGREYEVVRPRLSDPRFHLAAVIVSLHALGQTVLDFEISIAQILISMGTAGTIGFAVAFVRDRTIAWPASAVLAGNGVAFLLRVPGTRHGDWWSTQGWWVFAGTATIALGSKYLIRWNGQHIFNPSNFGLVICFLVLGSNRSNPLDFWWGPISPRVLAALIVIGIGGIAILIRLRIAAIAVSFWLSLAAAMGVLAVAGHCISARWHLGPICGWKFWWVIVTSPETLVFLFFMITDPKTSPKGRVARSLYGVSIGIFAGLFAAPQTTEFATKVAVLCALTLACALRPLLESRLPQPGTPQDSLRAHLFGTRRDDGRPRTRPKFIGIGIVVTVLALVSGNATASTIQNVSTASHPRDTSNERLLPPISIDPSDRVASFIDAPTGRAITSDVLRGLDLIQVAQRNNSTAELSAAAGEGWLERLTDLMESDHAHNTRTVELHSVERVSIGLARRPGQGAPAVMITLHGQFDQARLPTTAAATPRLVRVSSVSWEVKYLDNRYLITTDALPPGFVPPP